MGKKTSEMGKKTSEMGKKTSEMGRGLTSFPFKVYSYQMGINGRMHNA